MTDFRHIIKTKRIHHRGAYRCGLQFEYRADLVKFIMTLPNYRYTKTHKMFYFNLDSELKDKLIAIQKYLESHEKPYSRFPEELKEALMAMEQYMNVSRYGRSTIDNYISCLRKLMNDKQVKSLKDLDLPLISDYFDERLKLNSLSYSYQNQLISAIQILAKVNNLDISLINVKRPKRGSRLPEVLSLQEVMSILKSTRNEKHRNILMMIYCCGLRVGELINLKRNDLNWERGTIMIRHAKGNKDRLVPFPNKMQESLRTYLHRYQPKEYIFQGQGGGKYSASSVRSILFISCKAAGIKRHVRTHTLRHSYATHMMEKGVNLRYIQELLGHKNPKTTMIYTHVANDAKLRLYNPLDDLEL
jgi:site-specific recombinase XerD